MAPSRNSRRRNSGKKTRMNFTAILVIIVISVLSGYLMTRFVVYPLIVEGDASVLEKIKNHLQNAKQDQDTSSGGAIIPEQEDKILEDGLSVEDDSSGLEVNNETTTKSGYAIQFGSFSTKAAAENLISELSASGISAEVVERDEMYKVLGKLFDTKEQAVLELQTLDRTIFTDVFITTGLE